MRRALLSMSTVLALAACNEPPDGLGISIAPADPLTGDDLVVSIDAPATDPNSNDQITYGYAWSVDSALTEQTGETVPSTATRKGQTWRVVVTPSDGRLVGTAASAEVTIGNTLPTATVEIVPASPTTEDRLEIEVETQDPDSEVVQKTYAWFVDGASSTVREDRLSSNYTRKGQVWEVVVTPSDAEGDGEPARASVTIANTPPSVSKAAVSPSNPDRETVVECVGTGWDDVDDDDEGYQVEWLVDGSSVGTEATLSLAPYARGSRLKCVLTPFDGEQTGDPRTSPEVTIGNAPPSIGEVIIGPADPRTGTELSATLVDLVDPDGDAITVAYSWRVNGVERGTDATLPGGRYIRDQKLVLVATPRDATDVGEPVVSNVLTSVNSPPVVMSVVLSPEDPYTDDAVFAEVVTDDADGDPVTVGYAWYVEGSKVAETGDTLDGETWFDKHEELYVVVTPTDTEDGTAETSDTLTAINTPPPAPSLAFDPEEPAADEDVVCTIAAQEPDADADSITYTFAWTLNGSAYTSATTTTYTGDTIPSSARTDEDEWVCIVTPNDGEEDGSDARRVLGSPPPIAVDYSGSLATTALRGGSMPGTTYNDDCPTGSALVGLAADLTKAGGYFAELAPRCAELTLTCDSSSCTVGTGTITTGTYRGGSGSYPETRDCSDGYVVTGFTGRAGWYLDQLTLRCHPVEISFDGDAWTVGLGTYEDLTALGGSGGGAFSRADCTSGKVATRATIRAASGQVDGFQLGCKDPALTFE